MSHSLNRRNISAIAKLEFNGLSHAQRIDAIAKALGFETGAALMGSLKTAESEASNSEKVQAVFAFGEEMTSALSEGEALVDEDGFSIGGTLEHLSFDTVGELNAYAKGVEDAEGWMDAYMVACQDDTPPHAYFEALKEDPKLTFEDWYAADLIARAAEEEEDEDI